MILLWFTLECWIKVFHFHLYSVRDYRALVNLLPKFLISEVHLISQTSIASRLIVDIPYNLIEMEVTMCSLLNLGFLLGFQLNPTRYVSLWNGVYFSEYT